MGGVGTSDEDDDEDTASSSIGDTVGESGR